MTALNTLLTDAITSGIPGLSVALADKNGLIWQGSAGLADITAGLPVKTDHLFGIGSITKTFIAVVILQLAEEGRLALNQTAPDCIPSDSVAGQAVTKVPNASLVTIAQLLNHTSGIPSWEDDPLWIKQARGEAQNVDRLWQPIETLPYIENTPPLHPPGTQYAYANTNHTLLGLVIESVSGQSVMDEVYHFPIGG